MSAARSTAARSFLIAVCLAGSVGNLSRATPLFPNPVFDVGDSPTSVALGDFNADGHPDLAVANMSPYPISNDGDVSVLLGRGDGTFDPQIRLGAGSMPNSIAVGDFNGDGRQDLAVANGASNDVSILLGHGDGTFGPQTRFEARIAPASIHVGDFNGDGRQDLAMVNTTPYPYSRNGDVSVLLGRGDGTFGPPTRFEAGTNPGPIAVGDFDGDGRQDLAVANYLGNFGGLDDVSILLGHGDGTFGPPTRFAVGIGPTSIAVGDFNGDERQDLAVANGLANFGVINDVSILLGRGDGTFWPQIRFVVGDRPTSIAVGDFNGDGRQDLAMANHFSNDVSVLLGHGDGTFAPQTRLGAGGGPSSIAAGDFNGDGREDLAVANLSSNHVSVLLGQRDGTFGPPTRFGAGQQPRDVTVGDFNVDGRPDLALANAASDDVSVLLGQGDGTFGPQTRFEAGSEPSSIAVGDFNADGRPDLAVANANPYPNSSHGEVSVRLGRGDGSFGPQTRFAVGIGPTSIEVGDFNADGRPDLAVANWLSNDVSVLLGYGYGTFGPQTRFGAGRQPTSIALGDFNGDGRPDLAVTNVNSNEISVLLGQGDGTFGPQTSFETGDSPVSVAVGDFNGDGRPDLAVANSQGSDDLSVLLGQGDGTFGPETRFGAGFYPSSIAVRDFNGDGRQDLAVANMHDVSVLLGRGDGTFGSRAPFGAGSAPVSIAVGDFNGDGRQDLAAANVSHSYGNVTILLNQGSPPGRSPVAVAIADARVECASPSGALSSLDGSASSDPDSAPGTNDDIESFQWFENLGAPTQTLLGSGQRLTVTLPLGLHLLALRVTDSEGSSDTAQVTVTVVDTTPPSLTLTLSPTTLWPPNHQMVPVRAAWQVSDVCDPAAAVALTSVTSSEQDLAPGSAKATGNIQDVSIGTPDAIVLLRAERSGNGPGRVYTLIYTATDASGNSTRRVELVKVPHGLGS